MRRPDRSPHDVERLRRSVAMLSPGQPSGLDREEAMALLADLGLVLSELQRLERGLRALLDDGGRELPVESR